MKMNERLQRALSEACSKGRLAYVLMLGGTNDILRSAGGAAQIFGRLRQLHETAGRAPYMPRVGVFTLPPVVSGTTGWDQLRRTLNDSLRKAVTASNPLSFVQRRQFLVDLESLDRSLCSDGVHYTTEGYSEFARRAFEAMQATIEAPAAATTTSIAKAT